MIVSELTLTGPDDKFAIGQYHGGTVLTVREIGHDSITFTYIHTFMGYNGFGGQLVTQDQGEIMLKPFAGP